MAWVTALAQIQSLAQELPYAADAAKKMGRGAAREESPRVNAKNTDFWMDPARLVAQSRENVS